MVFINDKKFACEHCIKGHRSSTCGHSNRPLFEVARKGRPISQCSSCRELRQVKGSHAKCKCPQVLQSRGTLLPTSSKARRYIASEPALPNGLREHPSYSYSPPDTRQQVESLLNPCCKPGRKCKSHARPRWGVSPTATAAPKKTTAPVGPSRSRGSPAGLILAPIVLPSLPQASASETPHIPTFGTTQLPPLRIMASLAGSGCTCGVECVCPGCTEHRGPAQAAASGRRNCVDGCGACVDARSEIFLAHPWAPASSIDRFLARAAALPAPPTTRMDVVNLPKLECCGGRCACPAGACGCGKSCDGCCQEHERDADDAQEKRGGVDRTREQSVPVLAQKQKSSCCGG
ncbi:copper fist DNA binding domain-containing protein [Mycena sp. CBHHK59/15]|nr:copper fist DNA binding domain-containing protein [Mycena sp. CBHHK59/15]